MRHLGNRVDQTAFCFRNSFFSGPISCEAYEEGRLRNYSRAAKANGFEPSECGCQLATEFLEFYIPVGMDLRHHYEKQRFLLAWRPRMPSSSFPPYHRDTLDRIALFYA
jgi:hypothetical protein